MTTNMIDENGQIKAEHLQNRCIDHNQYKEYTTNNDTTNVSHGENADNAENESYADMNGKLIFSIKLFANLYIFFPAIFFIMTCIKENYTCFEQTYLIKSMQNMLKLRKIRLLQKMNTFRHQ